MATLARVRPLPDAVAAGDLDELARMVDGFCSSRDWDLVVELRDRCRHALEQRGLQLWPAAEYAEYRLALEAPGEYAAAVVTTDAGRFALGPLWEVAASTHTWSELSDHLPPDPAAALAAHERVIRGEDLGEDASVDHRVLEIPLVLQDWEPQYPLAVYRADEARFDAPDLPGLCEREMTRTGAVVGDEPSIEALVDIGSVWAQQSNGHATAVAVEGDAAAAVAALGHDRCLHTELEPQTALALVSWAAASGGAYGRRRGGAVGRFSAWWLVAALSDLDWPPDPGQLGIAVSELRWWWWEPPGLGSGWSGSVAVESPTLELAWALEAHDRFREGDDPLSR